MKDGHVLVMNSSADVARLGLLVTQLASEGLSVVVGPGAGGSPSWAQAHDAAVLLLAVGSEGVPSPLPYAIAPFVAVAQAAVVSLAEPLPRDSSAENNESNLAVPQFTLDDWSGVPTSEYQRLVWHLRALVDAGFTFSHSQSLNDGNTDATRTSVEELKSLTTTIGDLGNLLSDDYEHSRAVRETLAEIGGTYRVVKKSIARFISAGCAINDRSAKAYIKIAHGHLKKEIRNGRAHCTRIGVRYERVGGLRSGIAAKVSTAYLATIDDIMQRLANADGDLFESMEWLGETLTVEARAIERLLSTNQKEEARSRVARATDRLTVLEDALDDALYIFQQIESDLGYAEPVAKEGKITSVTHQSITIYGSVVKSAIVAAGKIEGSSVNVVASDVRDDIKDVLLELHKATAEMTTHLPDDEAELAASVLKDLATEATKSSPRPLFWRRAANGLLDAAKKVTEVGMPVVELVTKLTALLA